MTITLAEFIKMTRESKELTLRDVEVLSNGSISNPYLSQIETGQIKNPSIRKLKIIADAFKINPIYLCELALKDIAEEPKQ